MDTYAGVFLILGILILVLFIGAMKSRTEWLINFVLRGIIGMMLIYFLNFMFADLMPDMKIGYNTITFLAGGFLGIPGVALLYGINFYMLMW